MEFAVLASGLLSGASACALVALAPAHLRYTGDAVTGGPQKFHVRPTPRVGGIAILAGAAVGLAVLTARGYLPLAEMGLLLLCLLPVFLAGLAEDITKRIGPNVRLLASFVAAGLAFFLLGAELRRLDLPLVDAWLTVTPLAFLLSLVCMGGVAHAFNIIDGYNGLATMVGVIVLASLALVAYTVGDTFVLGVSLVLIGALLGFLVWNYPTGFLFAGDSGAYLVGFLVALLSVLLVMRNPEVSAWFPLLLTAYPVWETLFSIYRKKFLRGQSPNQPDGVHLHMLIYKRLVRCYAGSRDPKEKLRRNALTSPYLWAMTALFAVPAVVFWNNTPVLIGFAALFVATYCALYWRIVRFRAPGWLVIESRRKRTAK